MGILTLTSKSKMATLQKTANQFQGDFKEKYRIKTRQQLKLLKSCLICNFIKLHMVFTFIMTHIIGRKSYFPFQVLTKRRIHECLESFPMIVQAFTSGKKNSMQGKLQLNLQFSSKCSSFS